MCRRRRSWAARVRTRSRATGTGVATGHCASCKGNLSFRVLQPPPKVMETTTGMAFDAARRNAQRSRNLDLREIGEVPQRQDVTLSTRERAKEFAEEHTGFDVHRPSAAVDFAVAD